MIGRPTEDGLAGVSGHAAGRTGLVPDRHADSDNVDRSEMKISSLITDNLAPAA